jgi:SNF2 family DNA or RNA helicase
MIQPGLLSALNVFGRDYGRPIETQSEIASDQLEKLRRLIEPQVIRRTKADVAKDLPRKIPVTDCRVEMSNEQRSLYAGVMHLFNSQREDEEGQRLHHLGVLQYLRLVCADPRQYGIETFVPENPLRYRHKAPKMDWLLCTLHAIRIKGEKALNLCRASGDAAPVAALH